MHTLIIVKYFSQHSKYDVVWTFIQLFIRGKIYAV